ncbi:MAG TPA: hypothetical protein VF810_02860 [Patescibacteria group bacterium]
MNFLKNKVVIIILVVIILAALGGGGYLMMSRKAATTADQIDNSMDQVVTKLSPEQIGLTIMANDTKKGVKFTIGNLEGIKSIEYQITYEADSTAQERSDGGEARVQRGITGEANITSSSSYESPWLDLGSCSKNVCRYDTGVSSVQLTLKIVKNDNKTYEVQKTLDL